MPSGLFFSSTICNIPQFIPFDTDPAIAPSFAFLNAPGKIKVLQSCNGLMLCSSKSRKNAPSSHYYVCNPSTKQFSLIPHPGASENKVIVRINLAYDPLTLPEYRLVCVWLFKKLDPDDYDELYQIEIYSPSSGCWRPFGGPFKGNSDFYFEHGFFWNGEIHFLLMNPESSIYFLYFDMETGLIKEMRKSPIPEQIPYYFEFIGECHGHLHIIIQMPLLTAQHLYALEMEKDYSGWILNYKVPLTDLVLHFPEIIHCVRSDHYFFYNYRVLTVIRGEEDEDVTLVISAPGKIVSYNLKHKSSKVLVCNIPCRAHEIIRRRWWCNSLLYIQNLAHA